MIYAAKLLVIVVVSVGFVGGQQCNELVCPGIGCLTRDNVCNDINDCPDGRGSYFDETNCSGSNYTCANGIEIHVDMLCDGTNDCRDNSDENGTLCIGTVIATTAITPTPTTTSTTSNSNEDDNGYDLVIPKLVLFILIPIFIIMMLIIILPIIFLCFWRRHKLKNMKYRVRIAESARIHKDTLEQSRLTQGTYRNVHAETSFTTMGQLSPLNPQSQFPPPVPQPNVQSSSPPVPQWRPPVPPSQSPIPQWRPPAPWSQSPVPRSPAPPPPNSRQYKPPAPPPPPLDELTPLQSTTDVTIEAQTPPFITGIANRTSTMSAAGAFDILATVTAAEAAKRRSTVSGVGGMNPTAGASKLQHSTSSRSAFHSLGQKEQPTTPPSSPPPPPPLNGVLPPPVAPKPKKHGKQQKVNEEPENTYDDTLEPLYEPIPGDQLETDYVDVVPPPFIDSSENIYDDDAGIHALQGADFNAPHDTYNVPTAQPGSYDTYDVPTSQPTSSRSDTGDALTSQPDNYNVPTSQPNSYDTYDVPASQQASYNASDVPTSQPNSYDTYDVPASQQASYNASDVPTSQPSSHDTYDVPPPRPPKPPQNPLDRLVEEQDPINIYDTDQEVCKLSEMGTINQLEVLDLNDND